MNFLRNSENHMLSMIRKISVLLHHRNVSVMKGTVPKRNTWLVRFSLFDLALVLYEVDEALVLFHDSSSDIFNVTVNVIFTGMDFSRGYAITNVSQSLS